LSAREIVAQGRTLQQAFGEAALAMFALAVDLGTVQPREVREVRAHGTSLESLLVHWITECGYVRDIEGFACRSVDFAVFDVERKPGGEPMRLHAFLHGEVDAEDARSDGGFEVASARAIEIRPLDEGYEIRFTVQT
jgi:SHS2 domain-containing protein